MILSRSTFEYRTQVLIEKIRIQTPYRYEAVFQNSGCFIHFKEKGPKMLAAEDNVQVKSHEAVLLKCGTHFLELLKETDNEEVEVMVVHLFPELLKELYIGELPAIIEKQSQRKRSEVVASSDVIAEFVKSLEFYFHNPSLVNDDLLELKVKELILMLVQSKNITSIVELVSGLYSPKKVHLKEVVELHIFSDLRLEQLAKLCNLSLSSFKRKFKEVYSDSPTNYIIEKRIEKSKELLGHTEMAISQVAYEIGFQDPLYFTRLFKKKTGKTPSSFRNT